MSNTTSNGGYEYALYRYTPSIPAAAIFTGVFLALSVLHCVWLARSRAYFFIPFTVGLLRKCYSQAADSHAKFLHFLDSV